MIPPPFDYVAPSSLSEAVRLLAENPEAKILSGGQSLIPMMKFRLSEPAMLVDIQRLAELDFIREEGEWLRIGALTRESALERSELVRSSYALLADTSEVIADPLVRNRATVGGNLAHADPANDHPAAMLAYRAQVVAAGPNGQRTIPVTELFEGPFQTSLARDEILTEIRIPIHRPGSGGAYVKLERKVGDYAIAAVAVQLRLEGGVCRSAGIGLTNVGVTPIRAAAAEEALTGKNLDEDTIRKAARLAAEAADPVSDDRGSEEYKRGLVATLAVRATRKAAERARGGAS